MDSFNGFVADFLLDFFAGQSFGMPFMFMMAVWFGGSLMCIVAFFRYCRRGALSPVVPLVGIVWFVATLLTLLPINQRIQATKQECETRQVMLVSPRNGEIRDGSVQVCRTRAVIGGEFGPFEDNHKSVLVRFAERQT